MKFFLAVVLIAACNGSGSRVPSPVSANNEEPTPSTTQPPTRDPGPGTRDQKRELNVRLQSPKEGDVVRDNPITVSGEARTFENNVVIRILDSSGELMVETFTTAVGEMGTFSAFSREVFLTRDPGPRLTVQALEYSAKDGSVQHLNSVTVPVEVRTQPVTLHFSQECDRTVAVTRQVPVSRSAARLLVEALILGPTAQERQKGANAIFPRGSYIRSVALRDGILTVDFNERLENVGGSCRALGIRSSLERTLTELPTVREVRITALGKDKTALQP